MKNFSEKLDNLYKEANEKLVKLIDKKGVESKHYSDKCLKIKKDDFMFNIEGGRYLTEIKKEHPRSNEVELIDNGGYSYHVSVMESEDFFAVVDHLIESYK